MFNIFFRKIVEALDIEKSLYRIGISKIFLRAGVLARLEEDRDVIITSRIIRIQAYVRAFLARRKRDKLARQTEAIKILQRNCASWLVLKNWEWWLLVAKLRPLLKVTSQEEELQVVF